MTAAGWTKVFPDPVAAKVTVVPSSGFPVASFSVMVTVVVVVPFAVTLVGEAEIVEFATAGGPAVNVTLVVSAPSPEGVAILTVLVCMTVD